MMGGRRGDFVANSLGGGMAGAKLGDEFGAVFCGIDR